MILRRPNCAACGRPVYFGFHVSDATWAVVVPEVHQHRVVCLVCFDGLARTADVNYAAEVERLYFDGDRAAIVFRTESAADWHGPIEVDTDHS